MMSVKKTTYLPFYLLLGAVILVGILLFILDAKTRGGFTFFNFYQNAPQENIATITLTSSGFTPSKITVKKNTRLVWSNKSGSKATVNSDNHPTHTLFSFLNLGEFEDGSTVQVVVDKSGTYSYHNHYNPSEKGTIVVQ